MTSKSSLSLDTLERDLATTPADVAALRRARAACSMTHEEYLAFLQRFGDAPLDALRRRPVLRGVPFALP